MAFDLFKAVTDRLGDTSIDQEKNMPDVPKDVRHFLGQLGMLQHIPIHYLVPDEKYLLLKEDNEGGLLKLFWLDTEWIQCLLDGALSLADTADDRQLLLNKAMAGNYVAEVYYNDTKAQIKRQISGLYQPDEFETQLKKRLENKHLKFLAADQPKPTTAQNNWCYTGFLMRSTLISSWVGVEVIAKGRDANTPDTTPKPRQVIRLERIANDTLFVLCEGIISQVEIVQPAEAFHFGFDAIDGSLKIKEKEVPFKKSSSPDVIDVKALKNSLGVSDSATFAQKMKSNPMKVDININWKQSN